MADYYIDVVSGSSGNSGADSSNPKQYISQAATSAGNRVFLKRGQVHPIATYKFFGSNTTLADYGTGNIPILQKTAGNDAWIYVQDATGITFSNFAIDGNGYNGNLLVIKPTTTGSSGHLLQNLELYGSANNNGLYIEGGASTPVTDITVRNCVFHSNAYHGSLCTEQVSGCLFDSCTAYGNGISAPAHGFSTYSSTASPHVSGVVLKNCVAHDNIDFNGQEGQGFQFDNNSTDCSFIGCVSYNNQGAGFVFNVGSGHKAISCIAYNNYKPALIAQQSTGATVAHNIFYGNCRSSAYTAEIAFQSTSTGAAVNNNILTTSDAKNPTGISVDAGSASGSVAKTNCIYGFSSAASGITPTGTITSSPGIVGGYRLSPSSPCIGAGTFTVSQSDYYGKEFVGAVPIGAVMPLVARSSAPRSVATRGVATRTVRARNGIAG